MKAKTELAFTMRREKRLLSRVGNNQEGAWLIYVDLGEHGGKSVGKDVGKDVGKNVGKSIDVDYVISNYRLSVNEGIVLKLIAEDSSITIPHIASKLKVQTRTVERYLSKLKDLELIERAGGKLGGYWVVTNVGKNVGKKKEE